MQQQLLSQQKTTSLEVDGVAGTPQTPTVARPDMIQEARRRRGMGSDEASAGVVSLQFMTFATASVAHPMRKERVPQRKNERERARMERTACWSEREAPPYLSRRSFSF